MSTTGSGRKDRFLYGDRGKASAQVQPPLERQDRGQVQHSPLYAGGQQAPPEDAAEKFQSVRQALHGLEGSRAHHGADHAHGHAHHAESKAQGHEEHDAQQHLVLGKHMAQGHGGVEVQAGHQRPQHHRQNELDGQHRQPPADAKLRDGLADLRPGGEFRKDHGQVGVHGVQGREQAHQPDQQRRGDEPDQAHDQLGPDQAVDADGQGQHQIALVLQKVPVKAADHQDHRHHRRGDDSQDEKADQQPAQDLQQGAALHAPDHKADGHVGQPRQQQHGPHDRQHHAAGGTKLVL